MKRIDLNNAQKSFIDFLRVVSMLFVLFGHIFSYYQITIFKDQTYFPYIQNIGVVVFFIISGFLNSYSLQKRYNDDYSFRKFVVHKSYRIHIELLLALIVITIVDLISISIEPSRYSFYSAYNIKQFLSNLALIHDSGLNSILHAFAPFGSGRPLWTLSVEWWLYMLHGYLYIYLKSKRRINYLMLLVLIFMPLNHFLFRNDGSSIGYAYVLGGGRGSSFYI